jgi:hypothetical protein
MQNTSCKRGDVAEARYCKLQLVFPNVLRTSTVAAQKGPDTILENMRSARSTTLPAQVK